MSRTRVYVPCDVVKVRVRVGYGESLSEMECAVLSAIACGVTNIEQLVAMFGLGERLTIGLLADLWRAGHVVLNFGAGQVGVTADVAKRQAAGTLESLPAAETADETIDVMIDKLSGTVMRPQGTAVPGDDRLAVHVEGASVAIENVPFSELQAVVMRPPDDEDEEERQRRAQIAQGRRRRVLSAQLSPAEQRETPRRRWLPLDVQVGRDSVTDGLLISVVDRKLPFARRQLAGQRLHQLVEAQTETQLAYALNQAAAGDFVEPPTLQELLVRLEHTIAGLADTPAGQRRTHHRRIAEEASRAAEALHASVASEVRAQPVTSLDRHVQTVEKLIESARAQVVLVAPQIIYSGLIRLLQPLRDAVARGAQVVVIWGMQHGDVLDRQVVNALHDLAGRGDRRSRSPLLIWLPNQPSRTHASMAIADDRHALVSGCNVLGAQPPHRLQIGVRIDAPGLGPCPPIEALLAWCRRSFPDYQRGQAIATWHGQFARRQSTNAGASPPPVSEAVDLPPTPDEPPEGPGVEAEARARAWAASWADHVARLRRLAASRPRPAARVVEDGAHRQELWRALQTARSRLVIASAHLSPEVANGRFRDRLRELVSAGVRITIMHGELAGDADPLAQVMTGLPPERMTVQPTDTHRRVLIADDEITVGSFDFLSRSGHVTSNGRRWSTEVSMHLVGGTIADEMAEAMGAPREAATGGPTPPPITQLDLAMAVQRLLNSVGELPALDAPSRARLIREAVDSEPDPIQLLMSLEAGATPDVVRVAAAHAVADARVVGDEAQPWLAWLASDRWREGAFLEAAVLREAVKDGALRPSTALAAVAATRRTRFCDRDRLDTAVLEAADAKEPAAIMALVAVSLADLLLESEEASGTILQAGHHADALRYLRDHVDQPWSAMIEAALAFWEPDRRAVPLLRIREQSRRARQREDANQRWERLDEVYKQTARASYENSLAKRTHGHLFNTGLFSALALPIAVRDLEAIRRWSAGDLEDVFRDATVQAGGRPDAIDGMIRRSYLMRLQKLVEAVDAVCDMDDDADAGSVDSVIEPAKVLARQLRDLLPRAREALAGAGGPERLLGELALADLEPLVEWGGEA